MAGSPMQRYVVLDYLAEGGMGAIYLGKKLGAGGFEKEVVLKQLLPEFTKQPEFIELFLREARISATLDHANIVHTIDLVSVGEEFFIVMEYVRGGDLRTLLKRAKRRKRRMPPAAAMLIASEVLSALAYAHAKLGADGKPLGLIHRDVSPSNILVSGDGEVKLTDFGIAKASTHNSVFYRVRGKVGYMSPEQAKNQDLDTRSDLYSTAVILYEMLTGERLFVAAGLTTSADELYAQSIPQVSKKRQDLPRELDKLMLRALAMDPDDRYQTARELQEALLKVATRTGLTMTPQELSRVLVEVCGPAVDWESAEVAMSPKTEAYVLSQGQGTDRIKLHDLIDDEGPLDDELDAEPLPAAPRRATRGSRQRPPTADLGADSGSGSDSDPGADSIEELDQDDLDEDEGDQDAAWAAAARPRPAPLPVDERRRRVQTASVRLANMEITSMINASQLGGASAVGERPLDPMLDSNPRVEGWRPEAAGQTRRAEVPEPRRRERTKNRLPVALFLLVVVLGAVAIAVAISVTGSSIDPERTVTPSRPRPAPPPTTVANATTSLAIESTPAGARVLVDDREVCTTPCKTTNVPSTTALVRVEHEGYLPWTTLVNFSQVAHPTRVARLRRRPKASGSVLIKTDAPCELLVDGEKIGHVTSTGSLQLPPGRAELTIVAPSGATSSIVVEIEEGREIERTITMP